MPNELQPAMSANIDTFSSAAGRINFYVEGRGEPVLLLHSINAAASAYEVKPLFNRLAANFRVYAPDLPGFGISERKEQPYSITLYVESIRKMIDEILTREGCDSCHVLALSLTSEFIARIARDSPQDIRSLAMVTPTGFRRGADDLRDEEGSTREIGILSAITKRPAIGRFLYRRLTRPAVIRYFLRKTFGSDNYDEGLAKYDEESAEQPGAEYAPLAFLSGRLFAADIRTVLEALTIPVWLAYGTKGDFRDFSESDWIDQRDNWSRRSYPTGALPHFELPDRFYADYMRFLETRT